MFVDVHTHNPTYCKQDVTCCIISLFPDQASHMTNNCLYSAGIHPWYVKNDNTNDLEIIEELCKQKKIIAIGESGIDKNASVSIDVQKKIFYQHIQLAEKYGIPLIIHCVKQYNIIMEFRKQSNLSIPWIIHGFNANKTIAFQLIDKNCYLSVGNFLFNEKTQIAGCFSELPLQHIFFETDESQNEIEEVYKKAAEKKKLSIHFLQKSIYANFATCFIPKDNSFGKK